MDPEVQPLGSLLPPQSSRPRPRNIELFSTHDVEHPTPSPPYQRIPNTSTVLLDTYEDEDDADDEQTPAYKSRSNLNLAESAAMGEKAQLHAEDYDTKKPSVHYTDDVPNPPSSIGARPGFNRFDTFDGFASSGPPSLAGTEDDDEDEDYDWSGEEDLLDEEAKFEQAMGVKKKATGWGPGR